MARRGGDDGERRKLSFSERDKLMKGKSRGSAQADRERERLSRSPVYERYKSQVSKMFSGGELPDMLREKLDPTGELKARDELMARIKKVAHEDRKAWSDAVREYTERFELPQDAYLLTEWLDHPRDGVVEKALAKIEEMADAGMLVGSKLPRSLDQRLRGLEMSSGDPDVQEKAKALRERLR